MWWNYTDAHRQTCARARTHTHTDGCTHCSNRRGSWEVQTLTAACEWGTAVLRLGLVAAYAHVRELGGLRAHQCSLILESMQMNRAAYPKYSKQAMNNWAVTVALRDLPGAFSRLSIISQSFVFCFCFSCVVLVVAGGAAGHPGRPSANSRVPPEQSRQFIARPQQFVVVFFVPYSI